MTAAPLVQGEVQFLDANGKPYAGGTLQTYIVGTTALKSTWSDPGQLALNTNPIILDAAGRAVIFGDGLYRVILQDALGNLVFDRVASSIASAAMAAVVAAPDLPTAQALLGIVNNAPALLVLTNGLTSETVARTAADTLETTRALGVEASLSTQTLALFVQVGAETTRALAAEAAILANLNKTGGGGPTDGSGHFRVTYPTAFPAATIAFVPMVAATGLGNVVLNGTVDRFGADVWATSAGAVAAVGVYFYWIAGGN